jgi:hypothetical protein
METTQSKVTASSYRPSRLRRKRNRKFEIVCKCGAYKFPHRMTGGRCTGARWAEQEWLNGNRDCKHCVCNAGSHCEVAEGQERIDNCRAFEDLKRRSA